jgi:hypothetical protein
MADQTRESRRRLLKLIAAGGGIFTTAKALPENWTRPVVDAVLLPAHAVSSPTCPDCEESYCSEITGVPVFVTIAVDGQQISATASTPGGPAQGTATCENGSFTILLTGGENPSGFTVTGSIEGDCSEINGTVFWDGQPPIPYTAVPENCNGMVGP